MLELRLLCNTQPAVTLQGDDVAALPPTKKPRKGTPTGPADAANMPRLLGRRRSVSHQVWDAVRDGPDAPDLTTVFRAVDDWFHHRRDQPGTCRIDFHVKIAQGEVPVVYAAVFGKRHFDSLISHVHTQSGFPFGRGSHFSTSKRSSKCLNPLNNSFGVRQGGESRSEFPGVNVNSRLSREACTQYRRLTCDVENLSHGGGHRTVTPVAINHNEASAPVAARDNDHDSAAVHAGASDPILPATSPQEMATSRATTGWSPTATPFTVFQQAVRAGAAPPGRGFSGRCPAETPITAVISLTSRTCRCTWKQFLPSPSEVKHPVWRGPRR